jgi:antitoxin HicB
MKKTKKKGRVDRSETFDEFLAKCDLFAETEESALKEIIADQIKAARTIADSSWPGLSRPSR